MGNHNLIGCTAYYRGLTKAEVDDLIAQRKVALRTEILDEPTFLRKSYCWDPSLATFVISEWCQDKQ